MTNLYIGENIRKWRNFRGYQQPIFAEKVGVSVVTLSKYENGHVDISVVKLLAVAEILEITLEQLIGGLEKGKSMDEAA